jgi:ribosomal protein L40E
MSLQACHECGKDVSSEATACPHCGAKVKASKVVNEKKPAGKLAYIVLGLLAVGLVAAIANNPAPTNAATPSTAPTEQESPAKKAEYLRYSAAAIAVVAVKDAMRDPDSLKIESARTNEDGSTICVKYRARNGFGGMNQSFIVYLSGKPYRTSAAWNKHCTGTLYEQYTDPTS